MPLLSVRDLTHTYPNGFQALKGISFDVEAGEFLVVIGLSGSGKSTLLRCLNRLIEPTGGSITFDGQDVTHIANDALRKHRGQIGMIFQHFNLIPRHSVLNNVLYGALGSTGTVAAMLGRFSDELRTRALEALRVVGIAEKSTVRADALSGGQQQRVAIARALMQQPRMLLADEPVASLDPVLAHSILKYLEQLNKERGITVICSLHFLDLVHRYATSAIALKDGELVFQGLPEQIDDAQFKAIYGQEAERVSVI